MAREFARIRLGSPPETCGKTMLKPLDHALAATPLPDLGAVRVQGPDALKFLQGQLSSDTERLPQQRSQLAGLHSAQGRVIALLRLVMVGPDEVLGIVARELAASVATRLSKYVLRAKAKVTDASADWLFAGVTSEPAPDGHAVVIPLGDGRHLIGQQAGPGTERPTHSVARERWRALDIAAGIPQVYAATSEAFVAQMLNLDVLGAISFEKGCYTGQEIIARAHYRGRVKRRMQRLRTRSATTVAAGDSLKLSDGRSAKVVDAVAVGDGRYEFLAVTHVAGGSDDSSTSAESAAALAQTAIDVESLPLPYALPD
jgi:tRNA-modifying protein YgfZ